MCFTASIEDYDKAIKKLLKRCKPTFVAYKVLKINEEGKLESPFYWKQYKFGINRGDAASHAVQKGVDSFTIKISNGIHVYLSKYLARQQLVGNRQIFRVVCRVSDLIAIHDTEAVLTKVFMPKQKGVK